MSISQDLADVVARYKERAKTASAEDAVLSSAPKHGTISQSTQRLRALATKIASRPLRPDVTIEDLTNVLK